MEYIELIGSVTLIHLLAVMSPGPDFVVVMKNSLTYSRKIGIWTSIGIGIGIMVHISYSFVGLGLIISNSKYLFNIIKYAGAIYLLILGIQSILARSEKIAYNEEVTDLKAPSIWKSFRIGFLTNVLNPKATLFFLSLFTLVIGPSIPVPILLLISFILVVNTMLWFVLLSSIISAKRIRDSFNKYQKYFNIVFGLLLIAIAIRIALS